MGVSTKFIEYLDKAVQENLLKSDLSNDKAEGNLTLLILQLSGLIQPTKYRCDTNTLNINVI